MSKYDNTKFYWLQLKEDFFDEDAIDWLEDQPNGKEYSLFYLKLCLKSLRTNGVLIRKVGNMLVPYDYVKLGELTKTNPDTVMVAMNLLLSIGLVEKLENGKLYLKQVENMIGSQSKSAFKKQQQLERRRKALLEGGKEVEFFPPKIEKESEKEKDNKYIAEQVLYYLNEKANKHYKAIDSNLKFITARLKDYNEADLKAVIDKKLVEWKGTDMERFLRPETLFNATKFESYVNAPLRKVVKGDETQHFDGEREYSKQEIQGLMTDIDDIDF